MLEKVFLLVLCSAGICSTWGHLKCVWGQPQASLVPLSAECPLGSICLRFSDWETSWKMLWGLVGTWGVQGTGTNWFFKKTK